MKISEIKGLPAGLRAILCDEKRSKQDKLEVLKYFLSDRHGSSLSPNAINAARTALEILEGNDKPAN